MAGSMVGLGGCQEFFRHESPSDHEGGPDQDCRVSLIQVQTEQSPRRHLRQRKLPYHLDLPPFEATTILNTASSKPTEIHLAFLSRERNAPFFHHENCSPG